MPARRFRVIAVAGRGGWRYSAQRGAISASLGVGVFERATVFSRGEWRKNLRRGGKKEEEEERIKDGEEPKTTARRRESKRECYKIGREIGQGYIRGGGRAGGRGDGYGCCEIIAYSLNIKAWRSASSYSVDGGRGGIAHCAHARTRVYVYTCTREREGEKKKKGTTRCEGARGPGRAAGGLREARRERHAYRRRREDR